MSTYELLLLAIAILLGGVLGLLTFAMIRWRTEWRFLSYELLRYRDRSRSHGGEYFGYGSEEFGYWGEVRRIIRDAERENRIELTWAAREMLIVPIMEQVEERGGISLGQASESIQDLLREMKDYDGETLTDRHGAKNAVAVIRAFFKRFCNIPPFCSRTEETSR